jgi:argininosuccinate lyase
MTHPHLWSKGHDPADWLIRFTVGEDHRWDTMLLPYDVEGTRAHAWALGEIGVLTQGEVEQISGALDEVKAAALAGELVVHQADEDMHTVIERELTEKLGDAGQKIHAGRSRNDQVLVALRLWLRDALRHIGRDTTRLAHALIELGVENEQVLMPGYTHLRRAMPSTAGLWALGFAELLADDLATLRQAASGANRSPWGSAAGYGVPHLDLPREAVASRLGFEGVQTHVTAVQLSRGKVEASVVHALVQIGMTINRLASDAVLLSTPEFGFLNIPAEATTGSSIMPQKRNPDVFELARAGVHRLTAELHLLLTLPANLPSGYHRDLQLTKDAIVRAVLTTTDLLAAMNHAVSGLSFDASRAAEACSPDLFATEVALRQVVEDGVPFRQAYRDVGTNLDRLTSPDPAGALAPYRTAGTPGRLAPEAVRTRLAEFSEWAAVDD